MDPQKGSGIKGKLSEKIGFVFGKCKESLKTLESWEIECFIGCALYTCLTVYWERNYT